MSKLLVCDFSHWQGVPDWNVLAQQGYPAAIVKISQGLFPDQNAAFRVKTISTTSMLLGGYAFFEANVDAEEQADTYLSYGKTADFHILDLEWTPSNNPEYWNNLKQADRVEMAYTWLTTVEEETGKTPIIYTNKAFWNQFFAMAPNVSKLYRFKLWDNAFGGAPVPIDGFEPPKLWQYTDKLQIPTVTGNVDGSYFLGSIQELWDWSEFSITPNPGVYNPKVEALQRALKIGIDGKYGMQTTDALKGWQSLHGFTADGLITPSQWAVLFNVKVY